MAQLRIKSSLPASDELSTIEPWSWRIL